MLLALAAIMQVVSTSPPLPPAAAAEVPRTCVCISNRTNVPPPAEPVRGNVVVPSSSTAGPFGELGLTPSRQGPRLPAPGSGTVRWPTSSAAACGTRARRGADWRQGSQRIARATLQHSGD